MTTLQRGAFTVILAVGLAAGSLAAYRWYRSRGATRTQKQEVTAEPGLLLSVPPFSTREPNRYQAIRIITSVTGQPETSTVTKIAIARDGESRRLEYDGDTDFKTIYLDSPAGNFILLPSKQLFSDLSAAVNQPGPADQQGDDPDFSAERLLNEKSSLARYEKLGTEVLDGHATTKYRITASAAPNETEGTNVTLIWVDEVLGMPVRSETDSADGNHHSKLTVELRDVKLQVDPKLFELPSGYRKVDYSQLMSELSRTNHKLPDSNR